MYRNPGVNSSLFDFSPFPCFFFLSIPGCPRTRYPPASASFRKSYRRAPPQLVEKNFSSSPRTCCVDNAVLKLKGLLTVASQVTVSSIPK